MSGCEYARRPGEEIGDADRFLSDAFVHQEGSLVRDERHRLSVMAGPARAETPR